MIVEMKHKARSESRRDDIISPLSRSLIYICLMMRDGARRSQGSIALPFVYLQSSHPFGVHTELDHFAFSFIYPWYRELNLEIVKRGMEAEENEHE